MTWDKKSSHVAVLLGGLSAEREVSLSSGKAVVAALKSLGYANVTPIDMTRNVADQLAEAKPDVVFNALHGQFGEDGCVQGILDILNIPYTHSGVLASAAAMDKTFAKRIFTTAGIPVPQGKIVAKEELFGKDPLPRPYVVKPNNEGSSVGVKLVMDGDNNFFTAENWPYGDTVLVEEYIAGRELTVAVLDSQPLGVTELRVHSGFYDYENKYTDGKTEHLIPAPVSEAQADEMKRLAVLAHEALGCRGLSRTDFRLDETRGELGLYVLEINTQPGMTPLSLSPEQAKFAGLSFEDLVEQLLTSAKVGA